MKASRLISAAAAFLMLTGCGSGSRGSDVSISPESIWETPVTKTTNAAVSSAAESKAAALTKESVPMSRATEYFFDMITEERLQQGTLLILECLRDHSPDVSVDGLQMTEEEFDDIFDMLLCCEPELGWLDYNYEVDVDRNDRVMTGYFTYKLNAEEEKAAVEQLRTRVSEVAAAAEGMDDFDRMLYFHDTVVSGCDYSSEGENAWSAYGCLVEGKAVCEGYSKALIALCEEAGMLCLPVGGSSDRQGQELHLWNKVLMDGEWYNMDLTWDDPTDGNDSPVSDVPGGYEELHREYFGFNDETALTDHQFIETGFMKYPEATATEDNYFVHTGTYIDEAGSAREKIYTAASNALDSGELYFQVRCADDQVYDAVYELEFTEDGAIFDVLDQLSADGHHIDTDSYSFFHDEELYIFTVLLEQE